MSNIEQIDNKKIYDERWEEWVDMKRYGAASVWLQSLVKSQLTLPLDAKIQSVLDVGSGEGTLTAHLSKLLPGAAILGIDFSKSGVELSTQAYGRDGLGFLFDPESVSLNNSYDLVTAFEVLEHVVDWKELLGRMARASTKYVLLSFPTGRMRPFEKNVGHLRNFKKGEVEQFMKSVGFEPLRVWYAGFPFYSPLYRELCQLTNSASNSFTKGKYGLSQKIIAKCLYFLFRYFSTRERYGDQFCGLFRRVT